MDKNRDSSTSSKTDIPKKTAGKKWKGPYAVSESSHTRFYRKDKPPGKEYHKVTREEYLGYSESLSRSSGSFHCIHGPEGKQYTEAGRLKRYLVKELDRTAKDSKWEESCPLTNKWELLTIFEFLVTDPTLVYQYERLETITRDLSVLATNGYKVDYLDSLCNVLDFFIEAQYRKPDLRNLLISLLKNLNKPILLNANSDVLTYFESIRNFLGFLGYLLMQVADDELFDLVSKGIIYQLSAPDVERTHAGAQLRHTLAAATPVLFDTVVRMIAFATPHRFPTYMELAFLLACDSSENCIEMMKENVLENVFYRFNPFFPVQDLPEHDCDPFDPQDMNIKLGVSSINISITLSLLLVLLKTTKQFLKENPKYHTILPCPDYYSLRCFIWAYRYECRAREHSHERITLTVIAHTLLNCFGERLVAFSSHLMADVLALSVSTEVPIKSGWTSTVNFNTSQSHVQFKKLLIYLSVDFVKNFPSNGFMIESKYWILGLMYLLDPGLCELRAKWSPSLFAELRKCALQALVSALPLAPHYLGRTYGLIRRIMWYIEWYSESPYELPVLYWCLRLLQVATYLRKTPERNDSIRNVFQTHGIIILIQLCYTLLDQKLPPVEKSQAIIAVTLRLLTSAVDAHRRVICCVYPQIKWPSSINSVARKMIDIVLYSLDKHYLVSDRWLISLLNFVWEAIIWRDEYRELFVGNNGVYKLLDLITMASVSVQTIAMAMVCDVARAGNAVGQLVTWRASLGAANAYPNLVRRGATVATLLAAIFRDDCRVNNIPLDEYGIIQDLDNPLLSPALKKALYDPDFRDGKHQRTPVSLIAGDLAGSRMSKAFAMLHLLSEDLEYRVSLADEAYNLYKNIKLAPEDEAVLVLCSHYLTVKLMEIWLETEVQSPGFLPQDVTILTEFLQIGKGWAKQIKVQQEEVIDCNRKKEQEEESSLYAFLGRVRLNIALDALKEVRCVARSADRARIAHNLLHDAVRAHHNRTVFAKKMEAPILKTYNPPLDDQNITGQNVKVYSILPKNGSRQSKGCPSCPYS